jgi:hypothetical protein
LTVGTGHRGCKLPSLPFGVLELYLQRITRSLDRANNHDSVFDIAHDGA